MGDRAKYTLVTEGTRVPVPGGKTIDELLGEEVTLEAGQVLWVESGVTVHYTNPFEEESEYYALCIPAFTPERVGRVE